ncbi:NAD-dependent epimerase/dehydratase family protein [Polynucleobacter alcilacus]|uniref:NAD-dependent epimerase/dehydratase family protein n=1 Tax=Polynucleobacter alcilacus TaxID=1819739 RepID=UPI001C0C6E4A|nr:NAD-dependent epimerase/dehydratase family protein [Polynucleobacter alcilacus]
MKILITGAAGFIGSALALKLLSRGNVVIGIDNHNSYYDPKLKEDRLARHKDHANYTHLRFDISDAGLLEKCFIDHRPNIVVNLAAQAGVRYSVENPYAYLNSNIVGFLNILESCRHHEVSHLVYASSSSIYGANTFMPFSERNNANHPLSFYAASKKSNELMAHSYSSLYGLPTTGLRLFTVYGPWSRPDMALCKFADAMMTGNPIQLYNYGQHRRDFTYIDDVVEGIIKVLGQPATSDGSWNSRDPDPSSSVAPWRIYNLGSGNPVELNKYVAALELALGIEAKKEYLPMQAGDLHETFSDNASFFKDFGFMPKTHVEEGVKIFSEWYLGYMNK